MRKLTLDTSEDPLTLDIIQVLQLRTGGDPWLPRLETFECREATDGFIFLIPLLLSPKTTEVRIGFAQDAPNVAVGSMIAGLSTRCPDLELITLHTLPRGLVIAEAVSELLFACNQDVLRKFHVESPLTEEARGVVYRLPNLSDLRTVIQGPTSLPTVALPNLTAIDVEHDDLNWLQGFDGATLARLEAVTFRSESEIIGDFLGAFERVALTTSAQNTLSQFRYYTPYRWDPNYSSLHSFNQLKEVEIEFYCGGGCSSRVDDDIIVNLARAMPKLETLRLGGPPCATPTGITVNGFVGLARLCPHLSKLRVHFQATSLVEAATGVTALPPSESEPAVRQEDCALTILEVGQTPFPAGSGLAVAHILLQNFPRILDVEENHYFDRGWGTVAEIIKDFRRIGTFVHRTGKAQPTRI